MPTELQVHAVHEGGMRFAATAGEHAVTLDYPMRPGETGAGPAFFLASSDSNFMAGQTLLVDGGLNFN